MYESLQRGCQVVSAVQVSHQTRSRVVLGADVLRLQLTPSVRVVVTRRWRCSLCRRHYLVHSHIHLPGPLHGPQHGPFHSHLGLPRVRPCAAAGGLRWCCRCTWLTVRYCVLMLSRRLAFVGMLGWLGALASVDVFAVIAAAVSSMDIFASLP